MAAPLAIVDLGSNSARIVVFSNDDRGVLNVLADAHAPLRLIRELDENGRLRPEAIRRSLQLLRDFRAIAAGAGAPRIVALATAALREAANSGELIERARAEAGVDVQILDAGAEARAAFLGSVYSLPVLHGLVLDIGGGSLQVARFRDRRQLRCWSLPLGALRVSDAFLHADPPSPREIHELRTHLLRSMSLMGLPKLAADERLIGTGGTIRNLAKIDGRRDDYPIPRLHGYELTQRRLRQLGALLAARKRRARIALAGLNEDRADSIIGGCLAAECVLETCGAPAMVVSGLGLREGILLEVTRAELPPSEAVRRHSFAGLCRRFSSWDAPRADRRAELAGTLRGALLPGVDAEWAEILDYAARALDFGRSIDYYRRHRHSAAILRAATLLGFSHREIAAISAVIETADQPGMSPKRNRPLLGKEDDSILARAGLLLALADEIDHRLPLERPAKVRCRKVGSTVFLYDSLLDDWQDLRFAARFLQHFGLELRVTPSANRSVVGAARRSRVS